MSLQARVRNADFLSRRMSAAQAAQLIEHGATLGLSGFTGAGYPKALPQAIAERARRARSRAPLPGECVDRGFHGP